MRANEVYHQDTSLTGDQPFEDDLLLLEMANLPQEDTGIPGTIYISSAQGKHGARVKWYPTSPRSKNSPCLSVSIGPQPVLRNLNLPTKVVAAVESQVTQWVVINHVALLDFWNNGHLWPRRQVEAFIDALKKV